MSGGDPLPKAIATTSYERDETPDSRSTFGLDDGETHGIVLANALDVDGFLTGEFGGTNFPLNHEEAQTLPTTISPDRSWENNPYVAQSVAHLDTEGYTVLRSRASSSPTRYCLPCRVIS